MSTSVWSTRSKRKFTTPAVWKETVDIKIVQNQKFMYSKTVSMEKYAPPQPPRKFQKSVLGLITRQIWNPGLFWSIFHLLNICEIKFCFGEGSLCAKKNTGSWFKIRLRGYELKISYLLKQAVWVLCINYSY